MEETDARRKVGILYRQIRVGSRKENSATFDPFVLCKGRSMLCSYLHNVKTL
jgi:hypothetical protein